MLPPEALQSGEERPADAQARAVTPIDAIVPPALGEDDGTTPLIAPGALADRAAADPQTESASGLLRRLLRSVGIDRAVGFTVLARAWSSLAGIGTMTLIVRFLRPAEQGFYYTFYSLVALQIVFELGFSVVILQNASHEAAHLVIDEHGAITGAEEHHGRLADLLQRSVRWYTIAAILMAAVLVPTGIAFFRHAAQRLGNNDVHFVLPWLLIVGATAWTFQIDPLFSFLEGCGYVPEVARARFRQSLLAVALGWTAFITHHGLFAPGCMITGQAAAGSWLLWKRRALLLPLLRRRTHHYRIDWKGEVWPFQWRIAISWLAGYFTSQLFNPILMNFRGPVEAGQMGMTLNVCGTLSSMAVAWMNTKAAPFGRMIALGDYRELDRTWLRALVQSTGAAVLISLGVWGTLDYLAVHNVRLHGTVLSSRLLAPLPLGMMLAGTVGNIVVFAEALYLRAHKQEKFMLNSILGAVYIAPLAYVLARWHSPFGGAWGIALAYAVGTAIIGLGYGTYTWARWRRILHAA